MQGVKAFFAGFMTCALIAALMFANALYSGSITRGEPLPDIESYLPSAVTKMPVKKDASIGDYDNRIKQYFARQP